MSNSKYKHLEKVRDLIETCYRCGDCRTAIRPAVGRYQVCPVREVIPEKWEPFFARGKIMLANGLLKGDINLSQELADIIFQCMICGSCKVICNYSYHSSLSHPISQFMDHPKIWEALRAELTEAGFSVPRHAEILEYCQKNHNPYFEKHEERKSWVPKEKKFPKEADYVLYMGCTESYRFPEILQKIVKILGSANLNYTILTDEWCCGSVALRTGNIDLATKLAKHNFDEIKKSKAAHIITHCAGCYRTIKKDYPELIPDFNIEVLHVTEVIQKLHEKGQLKFGKEIPKKVTYHDPCHLGRHTGIFDAPRYILKNISGIEFVEMRRIKENSWCCGAGGGVKSGFNDRAVQVAKTRLEEALETSADAIVSACPFCLNNLKDGIKELKSGKSIEVLDLIDLIIESFE